MTSISYRPGTVDDSYAVFTVFEQALADLLRRLGDDEPTSAADPDKLARMWEERRSLYEHLALTAEHFWVAECEGAIVGFARAILRDGTRELTEMFVHPHAQSRGVGRELLVRAFPAGGVGIRSIIASPDTPAHAIYLRTGVYPRFPIYYWWREPEVVEVHTDLTMEPVAATPKTLAVLAEVDRTILGHTRDADHSWLMRDRQGMLYHRRGEVVGYGYWGRRNGPFALQDPADFPAVLADAESRAAEQGHTHFGVEVPAPNRHALDHMLARRFRIERFVATLMSDVEFGRFEHYIVTSPPFFL